MKKIAWLVLTLAALAAHAAPQPPKVNEKELRKEFTELKDQDSAKFRNIKFAKGDSDGSWVMCGEYNAKNSYGGYAGFSRFMGMAFIEGKKTTYLVMTVKDDLANVMCEKYGL